MEQRLVKIGEAARILGITPGTLRKWESSGGEHCGLVMDRDHNAAINILNHGEDTLRPTTKRTS
jgi:uncharacterized protein (UPF0548 family)